MKLDIFFHHYCQTDTLLLYLLGIPNGIMISKVFLLSSVTMGNIGREEFEILNDIPLFFLFTVSNLNIKVKSGLILQKNKEKQ